MAATDKQLRTGCGVLAGLVLAGGIAVAVVAWAAVRFLLPLAEDLQAGLMGAPSVPDLPARSLGQADLGWRATSLDGRQVDLGELRGDVVFLNVWATWCPPCRAEMPSIQRLHDLLAAEGVRFVLVSDEDVGTLQEFVAAKSYALPVYSAGRPLPAPFRTNAIPATFIVARDGEIVLRHVGGARWDAEASVDFLRQLLVQEP